MFTKRGSSEATSRLQHASGQAQKIALHFRPSSLIADERVIAVNPSLQRSGQCYAAPLQEHECTRQQHVVVGLGVKMAGVVKRGHDLGNNAARAALNRWMVHSPDRMDHAMHAQCDKGGRSGNGSTSARDQRPAAPRQQRRSAVFAQHIIPTRRPCRQPSPTRTGPQRFQLKCIKPIGRNHVGMPCPHGPCRNTGSHANQNLFVATSRIPGRWQSMGCCFGLRPNRNRMRPSFGNHAGTGHCAQWQPSCGRMHIRLRLVFLDRLVLIYKTPQKAPVFHCRERKAQGFMRKNR